MALGYERLSEVRCLLPRSAVVRFDDERLNQKV